MRAGGSHDGLFYRPTVLGNVTPSMAAFREEIFGPVAPVIVVKDADEAVRVANDTEYGLVAAVQTGSLERGLAVADQLRTGIVHVNDRRLRGGVAGGGPLPAGNRMAVGAAVRECWPDEGPVPGDAGEGKTRCGRPGGLASIRAWPTRTLR